jgi:hypothetical protein
MIGMDASLIICLVLTSIGLLQAGLLLVHAWEHRRFHQSRLAGALSVNSNLRVALIAPCKGLDPDLRANLRALFRQNHPQYELHFVVESNRDPALPVIDELAAENPQIPCRVVIAGVARGCGQKVHNLMRATAAVLKQAVAPQILAFVDSDACPHPDWLGRLVGRLGFGKHAVATGYRWYVPVRETWPNRLLSAINNTVIAALGPHGFNLAWGGAWAIRRDTFIDLGFPETWHGTLSDDLVVSRVVHAAGLRVGYEPHCLVKSAADFDGHGVWEFLRRQFVVTRVYAPSWWRLAFWGGLATHLVLGGLAGTLAWGLVLGDPRTVLTAVGGGALIWAAGAIRWHLAAIAVRPFVDVTDAQFDNVVRLNFWGWPLVGLIAWAAATAAAWGRTIVWRGIQYRLDSPRSTTILNHPANSPDVTINGERDSHARTTTRAA